MVEPTVIIVDDEPEVLDLLSRTLSDHHFRCHPVASLQQAKVAVDRHDPDLVVADVALGDGSGLDLLKYVRCARPSLPVIVVTGFPSIHVAEEALRLGAFDLIEKPFNINLLVEVVTEAAATRQRQTAAIRETLSVLGRPAAFVDRHGHIIAANAWWEQLVGSRDRGPGRDINRYVSADSAVTIGDLLAGTGTADSARAQLALVSPQGPVAAEVTVTQLRERREQPGGYVVTAQPIDGAWGPGRAASESVTLDPLTGCLNHRGFFEALDRMRRRALRQSSPAAILMINVDNFRDINQAQGYDMGDLVLQDLAGEIRRVVREEDLVGRYGGDEFIVALHDSSGAEAAAAARRLCAALRTVNQDRGATAGPVTVTIGVTECPAGYTTTNRDLAEQASAAVAWARENHEGPVAVYEEKMAGRTGRLEMNQDEIERLTREFAEANEKLKAAYVESARALVAAVEAKDPYTRRHSDNVARWAELLARELKLPEPYRRSILYAALLHDVGKIGIPDSLLTKPGPLSPEEFELVRQHPVIGANIVSHVSCMRREVPLIQHHHENWDGSGYPAGLVQAAIPLGARILRAADSFDAMTSRRSYKGPVPPEAALAEIARGRATLYDPRVVDALESVVRRGVRQPAAAACREPSKSA